MKINGNITIHKNNKKQLEHNSLTSLMENMILSYSISNLFTSASGSEAGLVTPWIIQRSGGYSSSTLRTTNYPLNNFCIYLLNLTQEEQNSLNKNTNYFPFINSNMTINNDKIIGYADFSYVNDSLKQGELDNGDYTIILNDKNYGVSFHWNAGKLVGTVNTIMIGTNMFDNVLNSICLTRGIDSNNPVLGDSPNGLCYLTNNVSLEDGTVITGPNEILLGGPSSPSNARYVLNLSTYEKKLLDSSDVRYNAYLFNTFHDYIGEGRIIYNYGVNICKYNTTEITILKTITSSKGYIIHNNYIYSSSSSSYSFILNAYDMETLNPVSSENITYTGLTANMFGVTSLSNVYISNYMNNFMIIGDNTTDLQSTNSKGLIYSDITNPLTSFIGGYCGTYGGNIKLGNGFKYIVKYQNNSMKPNIFNDKCINSSGTLVDVTRKGMKYISEYGYSGSVLTYSILNTPIELVDTDELKLDYTFSIG